MIHPYIINTIVGFKDMYAAYHLREKYVTNIIEKDNYYHLAVLHEIMIIAKYSINKLNMISSCHEVYVACDPDQMFNMNESMFTRIGKRYNLYTFANKVIGNLAYFSGL